MPLRRLSAAMQQHESPRKALPSGDIRGRVSNEIEKYASETLVLSPEARAGALRKGLEHWGRRHVM